jgi:hypothetical protein
MYNVVTGEIKKKGVTSRGDIPTAEGLTSVEGTITTENYVVGGVPVYVPPPPPTAEEIAAAAERIFKRKYEEEAVSVLYEIDKRLRILEGAPSITLAQFKQGLKTFLGL